MQYKNAAFDLKEFNQTGGFEGYASVFHNVDGGMDVMRPGAFTKTLKGERRVKMLWQHDPHQVIGVWDEMAEDERGLYVKGRLLLDVQKGMEAYALLKNGALDGMSIGYRTIAASDEADGRVRALEEVELFEISLVTFPMNERATVTNVKSIKTIREFEKALRDAGFSQREAKAVAAEGFKGFAAHRDDVAVDEPDAETLKSVFASLNRLQENLRNAGH